jgi:hypothetical protein
MRKAAKPHSDWPACAVGAHSTVTSGHLQRAELEPHWPFVFECPPAVDLRARPLVGWNFVESRLAVGDRVADERTLLEVTALGAVRAAPRLGWARATLIARAAVERPRARPHRTFAFVVLDRFRSRGALARSVVPHAVLTLRAPSLVGAGARRTTLSRRLVGTNHFGRCRHCIGVCRSWRRCRRARGAATGAAEDGMNQHEPECARRRVHFTAGPARSSEGARPASSG